MTKQDNKKLMDLQKKLDQIIENKSFQPKPDVALLKLVPSYHFLSKEEQIYFREITEAIFGFSEQVRNEYLKVLATDYHVTLIIPYLSTFIKETVHCNLVLCDLTLLIYAVRMAKSLLGNTHVCLKYMKYSQQY